MSDNIYHFLYFSALLVAVMLLAEFTYKIFKIDTEWTRKIAHVGSGIVALTYINKITDHRVVLALTLSFTIILYTSKKLGLFQSIFSVGRKSYGELLFVWSSWLLFLLYRLTDEKILYLLPFAIVVFADPAAALLGKNFPVKKYNIFGNTKSYAGSFAFFLVSLALSYYLFHIFIFQTNSSDIGLHSDLFKVFAIVLHAFILTIIEAISFKGWDNFSIPIVSVLYIKILINFLV